MPREVAIRTSLFSARNYGVLLNRVKLQLANGRQSIKGSRKRKKKTSNGDKAPDPVRDRAIKMVKEGAYRKAISAVTSTGSRLSDEENVKWADKLHPR